MSKSTTTTSKPMQSAAMATAPQASSAAQASVPQEKIAMLAYQKWLKGGCKNGEDKKHWLEAEAELKAEMMKSGARAK